MDIRSVFTKERIVNGFKSLGKLRIKVSHDSLVTLAALSLILFISFGIRLFPLRWEVQTTTVHITEFDGYFQYHFAQYMVNNGFVSWAYPNPWNDTQRWYPEGINVAAAGSPGLPMTGAFLYDVVSALGINIELMTLCALIPPILGMLASLFIYFLGKDIGGKTTGLLAALFVALSPSFIQRSSVGWFDDEIIGVPFMILFMLLFLRSIENDRPIKSTVTYAVAAGLSLGYLIAGWGAAYYAIGLMALFVFVLILLKRYTQKLLLSYSLTFGLGLFIAINVPKLSPNYLTSSAVLPVAGIFLLLCMFEFFRTFQSVRARFLTLVSLLTVIVGGFSVLWLSGHMRNIAGKFFSVIDPFLRQGIPLIESVAEHRISAWGSIYYEFGIGILFCVAGLYFVTRNLNNKNLFVVIFGLTALYFACSMVRLFVIMAPAFGLLAAIGIVGLLKPFITLLKQTPKITLKKKYSLESVGKEFSGAAVLLIFLILMTNIAFPMPSVYRQAYAPTTISAGSLPIAPAKQVNQWLDMLQWTQNNLQANTIVSSWWDYGYWLTILGNVTTLADNATINSTAIENIGFSFMANETNSLKMLKTYHVQYVLVFVTLYYDGSWLDGGGGDNGKWTWMARISGGARDRLVKGGFIDEASSWTNESTFGFYNSTSSKWVWNNAGTNSTVYKLMNWGRYIWTQYNEVTFSDQVSKPVYFDETFFSGKDLSQSDAQTYYGGIVPLVCLYKINWDLYNQNYPNS
ncbi:MAG TPA: STT3 domain-containing protein [Candidatus Bathyarchaeia archaeon]|nr:STT3 domain-containing protein [Candidatus Bathyarchaeia archaeon]